MRLAAPLRKVEQGNLDLDNVKAIIMARLHVLREYTTTVTMPTLKHEFELAGEKLRASARKLFVRDLALLDDNARQKLQSFLDTNRQLKTVHEYRLRLQTLWESSTASNDRLVQQFKDWCAEAEASGIEQLAEFARRLRGYQLARI